MPELRHGRWKGKTDGTPWMQRTLIKWFRHTSLYLPYFCMGWIVPFYMLFRHEGYLAAYRFYRKRFCMGRIKAFIYVYYNHFRFGQVIIDRFAAYAGHRFEFKVEGREIFDTLENGKKGFIQLSSHVGNYELAGYSLIPRHKSFHALVYEGETKTIMESRSRIFASHKVNMIPISGDMSHIFLLNKALLQGEIVSMPGDRIFGSPRSIGCSFFGETAKFPLGPFAMAEKMELPSIAVFVMKEKRKTYTIYVRSLKGETSTDICSSFAEELEKTVRKYPEQWFNYYDFWM